MQEDSSVYTIINSKFDIILASSSPRRYEILHDVMGIEDVAIMKPTFEENLDKSLYINNPIQYVCDTSRCKAEGIAEDLKENLKVGDKPKVVICADTVVIDKANTIYEKPKTEEIQLRNLKNFCYGDGFCPLRVVTAVTVIKWINKNNYQIRETFHEVTEIVCDEKIPIQLLEEYVRSGDGINVAGGFKIQGMSGILIKRIHGDYYNVVGLPLNRTFQAIFQETQL